MGDVKLGMVETEYCIIQVAENLIQESFIGDDIDRFWISCYRKTGKFSRSWSMELFGI